MNKNTDLPLSKKDRQLLALLEKQYENAADRLGSEPIIYADFDISPESENTSTFQKSINRMDVYSTQINYKSEKA